jgi:chloramphenicol O-acetyltransferase type B
MFRLIKSIRDLFLVKILWRKHKIGKGFHAGIRVRLWSKHRMIIGRNFYIGRDSLIECDAIIGDDVIFANRVALIGRYDHNYQQIGVPVRKASQIRDKNYNWKGLNMKIIIGNDVWVGYGVIILSGVKVGNGSIIAAGAIVTKDVEEYSIYAGSPARKVAERFDTPEEKTRHIALYNKQL